ncbi:MULTISPECIES: hypothetical protein [unclassified Microcoleus]|uniref:hypothetical protein n=1 Tax=unclassified Microcoleus TaxID=2642155 RepID=UPI002FD12090
MTWEDRLRETIAPTANKWPYRVIQVKPNKKKDQEIYTLSGREEDIAANGALFLALYDLLEREKIDFEEWWEQWENGFPFLSERIESNYQLSGLSPWRQTESRPRYREWLPRSGREKLKFKTIEYWRDRNNESDSVIFSGTDLQIINQIIQFEWQSSGSGGISIPGKNSKPLLKGWPAIVLTFYEPNDNRRRKPTGEPRSRVEGEKTIRCCGYSDDLEIVQRGLAELISNSDVRRWATKIRDEFALPELYRWQKGRECLSYSGQIARLQGLEGYALVRTPRQGKEIFEKLLRIFNFTPDPAGFKYSVNETPELAYPQNPQNFQLLGKEWEAETNRPNATVVFDNATLYLPKVRSPIPLVKGNKVIYDA